MKLVSTVPLDESQQSRLLDIMPDLTIASGWASSREEVARLLDADTEILYSFRVPKDVMKACPSLRWVQLLSAGSEHLENNPILDTSVDITTVSGVHATPIAEYVLAAILSLYRWFPQAFRAQVKHEWIPQDDVTRGARELRGRTVGIVGYGSIGREVARLVKPFGAKVIALKRNPADTAERGYAIDGTGDPEGSIPEKMFGPDGLHALLAESDVVVLALPSTKSTRKLIRAEELSAMKPKSYLINIARGDIVDEGALIDALKQGKLAGAALDVFEKEPLPAQSELWDMENVIVTSHISGASRPYLRRTFEVLAENLVRLVEGEPLLNLVDRELGY